MHEFDLDGKVWDCEPEMEAIMRVDFAVLGDRVSYFEYERDISYSSQRADCGKVNFSKMATTMILVSYTLP